MRFVADESVDGPIVQKLKENGHEVFFITDQMPGISDEEVLKVASEKQCVLVTQDKDFGELVYRMKKAHEGVVLLRLSGLTPPQKAGLTLSVINRYERELYKAFTVVYKYFVKIRKSD